MINFKQYLVEEENKDILKDIDLTKLTNAHMIKYLKDYNKSKDYK